MKHLDKTVFAAALGTLLVSALGIVQPVLAASEGAYPTDTEGQLVRSASGCVHTGSWKESMPTCPEPTLVVEDDKALIVFTVDDAEFFNFDQVKLSDQVKTDLDAVVNAVQNADLIHGITITGHSDKIGPAPYNEKLAMGRAQAVKDYLVTKGIPAERIVATSDGGSNPLVTCTGIKSKAKLVHCLAPNRRVDIEALLSDTVDIDTISLLPPSE